MYDLVTWLFKITSESWSLSHITIYRPIIYMYFNMFNHSSVLTLLMVMNDVINDF